MKMVLLLETLEKGINSLTHAARLCLQQGVLFYFLLSLGNCFPFINMKMKHSLLLLLFYGLSGKNKSRHFYIFNIRYPMGVSFVFVFLIMSPCAL